MSGSSPAPIELETGARANDPGREIRRRSGSSGSTGPLGTDVPAGPFGSVVDLFCGVGGLSHGFRQEGFEIAAGIDDDEKCRYAFEHTNEAPFIRRDVSSLDGEEVEKLFTPGFRRYSSAAHPASRSPSTTRRTPTRNGSSWGNSPASSRR